MVKVLVGLGIVWVILVVWILYEAATAPVYEGESTEDYTDSKSADEVKNNCLID